MMQGLGSYKTACMALTLWAVGTVVAWAQTVTLLHSFDLTDGEYLQAASLIQGRDGNLYGTTPQGGANSAGTVFKVTPSGTLTTLYSFCSQPGCSDGETPYAGLMQASDGGFYGTTDAGGINGYGTIFRITPSGTLTTLHSFNSTDGAAPVFGSLLQGFDGNLYGVTANGGSSSACSGGCGTIFKITLTGTLTTLHSFDYTDGAAPLAALIQAANGNFYGTTAGGGSSGACAGGCGTVFSLTPGDTLTTLHNFQLTDGANPYAPLIQASDGKFYGTTYGGGGGTQMCQSGCGSVFKMTSTGALNVLYSFNWTDGGLPAGGLVQGRDGNFYGTASLGGLGKTTAGTIFKLAPGGVLTVLYNFCSLNGCGDGNEPVAGLVQDTNGNFYGTTFSGGDYDYGTIYSLSVGLGPFVETQPTLGRVGSAVKILGTDLSGATAVTFNGTAATFQVVSRGHDRNGESKIARRSAIEQCAVPD
jgi:uncharacterized repeat protein (TIGR03803 family)